MKLFCNLTSCFIHLNYASKPKNSTEAIYEWNPQLFSCQLNRIRRMGMDGFEDTIRNYDSEARRKSEGGWEQGGPRCNKNNPLQSNSHVRYKFARRGREESK